MAQPKPKLLILHADDLAVAHSVDLASFEALEKGAVSSASVMVPCPWFSEVAAFAKSHPDADIGLHLTLTSEWKNYRWGPVARGDLGGLIAPNGYLWPEAAPVSTNATPEQVEVEIRAQIERALRAGIRPTHLDSHMAALFTPRFFPVYLKVAREYGLPFLAGRGAPFPASMISLLNDGEIVPDRIFMAAESLKPADWKTYYAGIIRGLQPGLTEIIVHLGHDNAELQAITEDHPAYGSAWRQRDLDLVTSPEFRRLLEENQVKLIGWRDLKGH